MRVSVIIPTIGRESLTMSVNSVLTQELKPFEIIIVVDETKCRVSDVKNLLPHRKEIRVITNLGIGVSSARNTGINSSRGELVAFLDDDDQWVRGKLAKQMAFLEKNHLGHSDLFVLSTSAMYVGNNSAFFVPQEVYSSHNLLKSIYRSSWKRVKTCIPTPSILVPRQLAAHILFDEKITIREDIIWLQKLELAGATIIQMPEPLILVTYDPQRSRSVETLNTLFGGYKTIRGLDQVSALKFLFGVGLRTLILKNLFLLIKVKRKSEDCMRVGLD
jgi:glycosyltransferase involved in cell wall biosynthesis